jgi:CubicO group peptidase (beta-lactamase class C family)
MLIRKVMTSMVVFTSLLGTAIAQEGPSVPPQGPATDASAPQAPPPATAPLTTADVEAWLDGFVPYALQTADIAGAVVVVVKDGQVLAQKGYGYSDVAARKPVDPNVTLFRPGSISKLFTWTSVMQLVEQGKLDLDTDVNQYLDFKIPERDGGPVTLRHIMTHTAGFEEQLKELMGVEGEINPSLSEHLRDWVPTRIFAAGTTPAYSNYATALAGYIVERTAGVPFDDYIEEHIFKPLGMQNASFRQPLPERLKPQMSQGYERASQEAQPFEIVGVAPAGSLSASGADMAKFMIAHLQNGAFGSARILQENTAQQMHSTALTLLPRVHRMLLGFYEQNYNGRRIRWRDQRYSLDAVGEIRRSLLAWPDARRSHRRQDRSGARALDCGHV